MEIAYFYPRSPCGERRITTTIICTAWRFLSTLSLRRATSQEDLFQCPGTDFYPRSPCGERRPTMQKALGVFSISIHALLAESDRCDEHRRRLHRHISIHALLAESDHLRFFDTERHIYFYPRSPCGERHLWGLMGGSNCNISIHALLAESD